MAYGYLWLLFLGGSVVIQIGCKNMIKIIYSLTGNIFKHYLSQFEDKKSFRNELT